MKPCFIRRQSLCVEIKRRDYARQPSWNHKLVVGMDATSTSVYPGLQMCARIVNRNSSLISCEMETLK
jgi:hypothetical protein